MINQTVPNKLLSILDAILADEFVLYVKTRNFHWNVTSPHFNDLHKFFQSQYEQLGVIIDDVAERSRALNGRALGSMKEFLIHARIKESLSSNLNSKQMLKELLADHVSVIGELRAGVNTAVTHDDPATADFLTGLIEQHEKMAWMLRSTAA